MSLVAAAIAALVVFIAGLVSDARIGTILLRCIGAFFAATAVVWLIAFVLEAKEIVGFDSNIEMPEPADEKAQAKEGAEGQQETGSEAASEEGGETGFTPLADTLRHMEAPPKS